MNIRFAIPTYKRPELIKQLTLSYLQKCSIPINQIDVFVSNHNESAVYIKSGIAGLCDDIINTCTTNVRDKFNYIHSYYPSGTHVVVIEDDIECIKRLVGYNKLTEVTDELFFLCENAFALCVQSNTKLWGISSNSNPFFLKQTCGPCFKLIVANMYGFIAENPAILVTQHTKTDYERTILYTRKYGSVVRLDYLCPVTKNYKNPGGMQTLNDTERSKMEIDAVRYLAMMYPELCKANTEKKSKYAELVLITKRIKPNTGGKLFDI